MELFIWALTASYYLLSRHYGAGSISTAVILRAEKERGGEEEMEKEGESPYLVPSFVTGYDISGLHALTKLQSMVQHHWEEKH